MMACENPGAADGYQQAKCAVVQVGVEAETQTWVKFKETIDTDFRPALKKFWQTVRCLRSWKQFTTDTVYGVDATMARV